MTKSTLKNLSILLFFMTAAFSLIGCGQNSDQASSQVDDAALNESEEVDLLFVQDAQGVRFDGNTMTLIDPKPRILYFADRPDRIAGHLSHDQFLALVSEGKDSFAENPPNATLAIFGEDEVIDLVLELPEMPRFEHDNLVFEVVVIEGTPPAEGGQVALFIDTVGRPASPGSVAGVHRRHERRDKKHHEEKRH